MKRLAMFCIVLLSSLSLLAQKPSTGEEAREGQTAKKAKAEQAAPANGDTAEKKAEESKDAAVSKPKESPLAAAAKQGRAGRKKSRISITDEDLKKTTGKLMLIESTIPYDPKPPEDPSPMQTLLEKQQDQKKAKAIAETRVKAAQGKVDELQKELDRITADYYEADNPDYREDVIEQRYAQTQEQLEKARQALALAKEELEKHQ